MKVSMNLKAKKLELVQLILNTDKPALLEKVEAVFKNEKDKDAIKLGQRQLEKGEGITHEEVRKKADKILGRK